MDDYSREDWADMNRQRVVYQGEQRAKQALEMLTASRDAPTFGYLINNYEHCLQTATMLHQDGHDEDTIVTGLFHDLGFIVCPENHGRFAADLAARVAGAGIAGSLVVPVGGSPAFLAPQPVGVLGRPDLADVLVRLGLTTLGAFAALSATDVVGRFGAEGQAAHRLAAGFDGTPLQVRRPPSDLAVAVDLDPPVDRIDRVAFAARALAEQFHDDLRGRGLACTRVVVEAETEHGERLARCWRDEGVLGTSALVDRVRWQLEGWLHGPPAVRPTAGLVRLALLPDEVVPATGHQAGFWGGATAADERAARALARVVVLLGEGSVRLPEWRGGRDPVDQLVLVPLTGGVGEVGRVDAPPSDAPPWPGVLPPPSPAAVHADPVPAELLDDRSRPVRVDGRGVLSAAPVALRVDGRGAHVAAWAGPWPVDERWWDPRRHRRRVRLQVVADDGVARLLVLEAGCWRVAATYD
ncbi:MAG TPA: DNA polymerase Y family protein [Acidobacteria bacterium]|nr:DNA polymerase Y family protein [Acidobacteriota bacterium]